MTPAKTVADRSPAVEGPRRTATPAGPPPMSALRRIQRYAGNRATERLLAGGGDGRLHRCGPVPCDCSPEERLAKQGLARSAYEGVPVSDPAEPAEREADAAADRVMRMPDAGAPVHIGHSAGAVRRHAVGAATPAATGTGLAGGIAGHVHGGGQALDAGVRQFMEPRFGRRLDDVRVHTDSGAGRLARQVDAYAFTVGQHIFFSPGQYRPGSHDGRRLLAHELAHVVQQGSAGPAVVHRQAKPGTQSSTTVPAEKTSSVLESAYRRLGDTRRAAAIRMCRERGGGACNMVLTQAELRKLYDLAQQSGGDEKTIRAGLANAAPAALGVAPVAAGLTVLPPGVPPVAPIPPVAPVPPPPVGVPGYPTWSTPPPVTTPGAGVAGGEVVGAEAVGAGVSVGVVAAAAVTLLVVACALVAWEAWQLQQFRDRLEADGFIVLDDALGVCISGCHASPQPIRPYPDLDVPLRRIPDLPETPQFPGRQFPPWSRLRPPDKQADPRPWPFPRVRPGDPDTDDDRRRGCFGTAGPPRGGNTCHDRFATSVSGVPREWVVTSRSGVTASFDARSPDRETVWEMKTGYGFVAIERPTAAQRQMIDNTAARWQRQWALQQMVADECGLELIWAFTNRAAQEWADGILGARTQWMRFNCDEDGER